MNLLTKLMLFLSVAALGKAGLDPIKFKEATSNIKNDYKEAGVTVKKYIAGDTNHDVMENVTAINNDINDLIDSYDVSKAKDKITDKFITLTDFIFNDTEIKGVTFKKLTQVEKEIIMDAYNKLDEKINAKFPDYKEKISEKTENISEVKDELKEYTNEKIIEAIGQENYDDAKDKIEETKEKAKTTVSNTYTKAKDKVTTWYNNLKQKKES